MHHFTEILTSNSLKYKMEISILIVSILEDFENASPYFALFLQTVYAIEKLLAGFNVQPIIGMNQSLI